MYIDLTPELKQLRARLRGYFEDLMTPELQSELKSGGEGGGPQYRQALKKMGRDGWLGIGWPKEYGGQGRTPLEQYIFADEVQRVGYPLPFLTLGTVGPTLMKYGSEELKDEFLPRILAGECHFAIGYSAPGAGTDLAGLTTSAHRGGDEWVITGQKPLVTKARKSIAQFKLREGMPIGAHTTLRGDRMWEFLDRLLSLALPRIRDFRGLSSAQFDGRGNYTFGLTEQVMFHEIDQDRIDRIRGMDITVVTTARNNEEGRALLKALGFPFKTAENTP